MLAQVTNLKPGLLTVCVSNAHIYENHIEQIKQQLEAPMYEPPKFWINPDITNFYDFTADDVKLIDYKHGDKIKAEVAV